VKRLEERGRVALAYSGGLDSTLLMILLEEHYGFNKVIPVLVDVGQGEEEITIARERAEKLDKRIVFFDSKTEFTKDYIFKCIKANGNYEGYPVGTSMSRVLIASKVSEIARREKAEAVAHGCTGKGNDQFRMENTFRYYVPEMKIVAPVRELDLSRPKEEEILRQHGIQPERRIGTLGGDVNMWSHSIGSGQVEDLTSQYLKDYIWAVPPEEAPDKSTEMALTYEGGIPVELNGVKDPVRIVLDLDRIGGANGIGRIDIIEDGILGLKSRELYEAPAASILLTTHADLEGLTLTKEQRRLKRELDRMWADMVYHGMWLHPLRRDIEAFIDSTQQYVSGKIIFKIFKGMLEVVRRESDRSLFTPELRSVKKGGFDQREATGAVKISGLQYQLFREKGR
jgi:argininosuccinate synthase